MLDGIAIHPYRPAFPTSQGPENTLFEDELLRWGLMAEKYGMRRNDLWLTEVGVPVTGTAHYGGSRRQQAEWMVAMHLVALKLDLPCLIWFKGRPSGSIGPQEEALIDKGGRPRRMYAAYVTMTQQLAAANFRYELDTLGATAMGYVFEHSGEPLLVLWDWMKSSRVGVDMGADQVTVIDIVGGRRMVKTQDRVLNLMLTPDMQYIQGCDPSLFLDRKARSMIPDRELIKTEFEKREQINVHLVNPFHRNAILEFGIEAPDAWLQPGTRTRKINFNASQKIDTNVAFTVPSNERWGLHRLMFTLREHGLLVARLPVHVHIDGPKPLVAIKKQDESEMNVQ